MGTTMDNLQAALSGESQANRRYLFFAEKAEKEGHPQVAKLFRAVADAETVHARNHFDTLGGIGATADNLRAAIDGEGFEFRRMYPEFIEQAKKENNKRATSTFEWAGAVEKIHHGLYEEALKAVSSGQKIADKPYFVCQACGYTVAGEAPDKCPVCGALKIKFKQIS